MNSIVIHRPLRSDVSVAIKSNSQQVQKFMNEDVVQVFFERATPVDLRIGDYIEVYGKTYLLNTVPQLQKLASNLYDYQVVFESYFYNLSKATFLDADATGIHITHEFYLTGQFQNFIDVIKNNLSRVFGANAWTFDVDVSVTEYKTLSFSENNCQQALIKICEEFGVEFKFFETVDGLMIYIRDDVSLISVHNFEYGKGKGLYDLTRQKATANNLTTRLFVFGSTKNLGPNYRNYSPRLRMPGADPVFVEITNVNTANFPPIILVIGNTTATYVQLQIGQNGQWVDFGEVKAGDYFNSTYLAYNQANPEDPVPQVFRIKAWNTESQFVYSDGTSEGFPEDVDYLENETAIANYGVIERTVIFDEVFPHREGTVSGIGPDYRMFSDAEMFDLKLADHNGNTLYLIPGLEAKVKFNTGKLAGYEFIISDYKHDLKQFTLRQLTDERGLELPHPTEAEFQVQVGDKYVILDINLPHSYIEAAENELLTKGTAWLEKYSNEQISYKLSIDEKYVSDNSITFPVGNKISVVDAELGLDDQLRIVEATRNLVAESQYEVKLSDTVFTQSTRTKYIKTGVDSLSLKNSGAIEPQIQSDWEQENQLSPAFIRNKPEIPDAQIQSDWEQDDTELPDYIKNKPESIELPEAELLETELPEKEIYSFRAEEIEEQGIPIIITEDIESNEIVFSLNEQAINHNNLLNFEEDRHRKMNYDPKLKVYLIED